MKTSSRADLVLFGATAIWGSTFALIKLILVEISPLQMQFIRFGTVAFLLLAVAPTKIIPANRTTLFRGIGLGTILFLGMLAQNVGLSITTASKSAFITGMMVIFVPLLQFLIERKAPLIGNLIGVVIVSLGLWFLTSPESSSFNLGDAITLFCAIIFAVYIVLLDLVSREMTTLQLTFLQSATTALLTFLGIVAFGSFSVHLSMPNIISLAYLTLFATLATTYAQTRFQKDTTPTRAVIIFTIEPVFAAILAYFLLRETLGTLGLLGGFLIICGVLLSEVSESIPFLNRALDGGDREAGPVS